MLITITLFAALAVALVGTLILWSNPTRLVNRVVFTCSVHIAMWLGCLHLATTFPPGSAEGLFWVKMASAVGGFVPMHFWIVNETIATGMKRARRRVLLMQFGFWFVISAALAVIVFTEHFIPSHSTDKNRVFGWGYYGYIIVDLSLYGYLITDALRTIRRLEGGRRIELQTWLLGGCSIAATVLALMAISAATHDSRYIRLQPLVILVFFTATAIAITTYRIFDARQVILVAVEKALLVTLTATVAVGLEWTLGSVLPRPFDILTTTALTLAVAWALSNWLDRTFRFYPQAMVARQAAFAAARRETRVEDLERAFLAVLKGWGQSDHALVLSGAKDSLRGCGIDLPEDCPVAKAMRQLRWATPERLARERPTPDRQAVGEFLEKHALGVVVVGEGPTLTVMIGVGHAASRRAFTYPQVTQLMELASIIESALERAHFSVKAQRAEQLATVGLLGASLAHEIRNPLVTIKTFVQLLPKHHQDPIFREKFFHLIGDEVTRIDRLTEQLLDLAAPRTYTATMTDLHPVLGASIELVAAKASDKRIRVVADLQARPDRVCTDATAAKQVLLNLCFNAIQAVENREGERWVKVSTQNVPAGLEMAVEDSGPGIAPEIRPRLFQPFQSTKSTGFGLGLAICSDILAGLNATITVDPPAPGRGATFRVTFPCQPFSS